jgi:HEAT repeat protein
MIVRRPKDAVPALIKTLFSDDDLDVRKSAQTALGKYRH